jgi:hypothetical protein
VSLQINQFCIIFLYKKNWSKAVRKIPKFQSTTYFENTKLAVGFTMSLFCETSKVSYGVAKILVSNDVVLGSSFTEFLSS